MPDRNDILMERDYEEDTLYLYSPYNRDFVEALKITVPQEDRASADDRGWDPDEACWAFLLDYEEEVTDLCKRYFPELPIKKRDR